MLYLFLDESGDLGFDFVNKKPSSFFTIIILLVRGQENLRGLSKAIRRTIHHKLKHPKQKGHINELKGSSTTMAVKEYFMRQVSMIPFDIYALTLNKRRVYEQLAQEKSRVYNFISRLVLDKLPLGQAQARVQLIIDKSKSKVEIIDFNQYIETQLRGRLNPRVPLDIYHWTSHETAGLQAADLFAWGVFRKYERGDTEWFDCFEGRLKLDDVYFK